MLRNAKKLYGDTSGIYGDAARIRGDATGLVGDVSSLRGDVTNITGVVNAGYVFIGDNDGYWTGFHGDVTYISGDITEAQGNATGRTGDISSILPNPIYGARMLSELPRRVTRSTRPAPPWKRWTPMSLITNPPKLTGATIKAIKAAGLYPAFKHIQKHGVPQSIQEALDVHSPDLAAQRMREFTPPAKPQKVPPPWKRWTPLSLITNPPKLTRATIKAIKAAGLYTAFKHIQKHGVPEPVQQAVNAQDGARVAQLLREFTPPAKPQKVPPPKAYTWWTPSQILRDPKAGRFAAHRAGFTQALQHIKRHGMPPAIGDALNAGDDATLRALLLEYNTPRITRWTPSAILRDPQAGRFAAHRAGYTPALKYIKRHGMPSDIASALSAGDDARLARLLRSLREDGTFIL